MKIFDNLYARNSNGKINVWELKVVSQITGTLGAIIKIEEGLFNGTKTLTEKFVNKGKNLGKMNATSSYEQACSEAESRWIKKKKQGYKSLEDLKVESVDEVEIALPFFRTDANNISKPMKAQPYYKVKTENGKKIKTNEPLIKFPCYGQPKLNGFRVMARWEKVTEGEGLFITDTEKVVFRSKEGLKYDILEHIEAEFTKSMFLNSKSNLYDMVFDGEMYIHGEILSEISSAVRKRNDKTKELKFWIFDLAIENVTQAQRLDSLSWLSTQIFHNLKNIIGVYKETINSNEEAQKFTDICIEKGYEGAIFRDKKAFYQFGKRPQTMTKLKRSEDKEFKIIDVVGGENTPNLGVFVCVQEQGLKFDCTPEGSHELKKKYLINKHKYIGKMLTVRFFERTKDNKPFHAIGTVIRDYE